MKVRVTRAYLAGFGTAGSVLACGAVVFVLATAVVAFGGWPKIADQLTPGTADLAGPVAGSARIQLAATVATIVLPAAKARPATRPAHRRSPDRATTRASAPQPVDRWPSTRRWQPSGLRRRPIPTGGVASSGAGASNDAGQASSSSGSAVGGDLGAVVSDVTGAAGSAISQTAAGTRAP